MRVAEPVVSPVSSARRPTVSAAFDEQYVQAFDVRAGQAQPLGDRLAEECRLAGAFADGSAGPRPSAPVSKRRLTSFVCPGYSLRCAAIL